MAFIDFKISMKKGREIFSWLKYLICVIRFLPTLKQEYSFFNSFNCLGILQCKFSVLQLLQFLGGNSKPHNEPNSLPQVGPISLPSIS